MGFRIPDQSANATARGDAFAATADDPSAIYYNPAGITQLSGTEVLMGGYAITLKSRVTLDDHGGDYSSINRSLQTVPTFFLTWKPDNAPIALGLGMYSPFGFSVEYPDDTPFRTIARKGSIEYITLNPVLAWQITKTLSVAAGPTISYGKAELDQGIVTRGDNFQFRGDGIDVGLRAGIMWDPHPMHHFGLTYQSPTRMNFDGHTTTRIPSFDVATPYGPLTVPRVRSREEANAEFNLPQVITLGYSFRPKPDWNFEFDLDWTGWDTLNNVTLHQRSGDITLPFDWHSSFMYEFGITKQLPNRFHASVGYVFSQKTVPNETFDPAIPDSNRHILSAGIGQKFNDHVSWALAYQLTFAPPRTIDQGTASDGVYRFISHAFTLSLGYNF